MTTKQISQENLLKFFIADMLIDTAESFNQIQPTKGKTVADITETYSIYTANKCNSNLRIGKPAQTNDYRIVGFTSVNDVLSLSNKLVEAVKQPAFFGAIVFCEVKEEAELIPFNPLSVNFISSLERSKVTNIKKLFLYFLDKHKIESNVDDIAKAVEISYANLGAIELDIGNTEKETYIDLMATRESNFEELGMHLDQLHVIRPWSEDTDNSAIKHTIMRTAMSQVWTSNVSDAIGITEDNLPSNWCVELQVLQSGIITPTYGLWGKDDTLVKPVAPVATLHPNVSRDYSSYCTGVNLHNSIKGISELSYGNQNSPLNSQIGLSNTLTVAKAYQKVMLPLLLSTRVGE